MLLNRPQGAISRRQLMQAGMVMSGVLLAGSQVQAKANTKKIGFIYVGPQKDYGYNYSMDLGRLYVEKTLGVTTTYFDNIPESAEVERVMERLIKEDHGIIFATSYGYLDHAIKVGEKYPEVSFLHAGGLKLGKNVGTYWADSDDAIYLAGMVAGSITKSNKFGFLGAFQIPQVLRTVNAFTRGAQSVNPAVTTTVVWTGAWLDPAKEAEAANSLIDGGADVLAGQVDSPLTFAQTAEKRGVYVVGKDVNVKEFAPKAWLTGASWDWGPMMVKLVQSIQGGTFKPEFVRGTLADGAANLDPFGPAVSPDLQKKVLDMKAQILSGKKVVWSGPIVKQDGTQVVADGVKLDTQTLESMNFLVKGVIGTVG